MRITTPGAVTWIHPIVFPSITVFGVEIVDGPVYAVSVVPAGTPVLEASGKPVEVGAAGVQAVVVIGGGCLGELLPALSSALTPTV